MEKRTHLRTETHIASWKTVLFFGVWFLVHTCDGHGRLIEPPSRASAWRYGFQTVPDYNDHELYCGGFTRQWRRNGGKCGECGDAWDMPEPRPHENGGQWGQGVIVRRYLPKSEMTIRVELTASHMGYFEFRLCPKPNAKQACLDQNLLRILGGSPSQPSPTDLDTRFYPRNGSRIYEIKTQLPEFTCDQCVLQWKYVAGNNWGTCSDGNGAVGCGPQEEFRACSDIAMSLDARNPIRPSRPVYPTAASPNKNKTTTEQNTEKTQSGTLKYLLIASLSIVLLVFLCVLAIWYRFNYFKKWIPDICIRHQKSNSVSTNSIAKLFKNNLRCDKVNLEKDLNNVQVNNHTVPPIPPPRTKRVGGGMKTSVNQAISC